MHEPPRSPRSLAHEGAPSKPQLRQADVR